MPWAITLVSDDSGWCYLSNNFSSQTKQQNKPFLLSLSDDNVGITKTPFVCFINHRIGRSVIAAGRKQASCHLWCSFPRQSNNPTGSDYSQIVDNATRAFNPIAVYNITEKNVTNEIACYYRPSPNALDWIWTFPYWNAWVGSESRLRPPSNPIHRVSPNAMQQRAAKHNR